MIVAIDTNPPRPAMIVCSCNVLSDHDVRGTLAGNAVAPRTAGQVYGCLGCSPQCGRCARTIRRIMDEALATENSGCPESSGCATNSGCCGAGGDF
jgi:bacterioferritin-associated ferredoxin